MFFLTTFALDLLFYDSLHKNGSLHNFLYYDRLFYFPDNKYRFLNLFSMENWHLDFFQNFDMLFDHDWIGFQVIYLGFQLGILIYYAINLLRNESKQAQSTELVLFYIQVNHYFLYSSLVYGDMVFEYQYGLTQLTDLLFQKCNHFFMFAYRILSPQQNISLIVQTIRFILYRSFHLFMHENFQCSILYKFKLINIQYFAQPIKSLFLHFLSIPLASLSSICLSFGINNLFSNIIIMKDQLQQKYSTDSLELKLLTTRYSVVDQMLGVRDSLQKQQRTIKQQKMKIQQLNKRILHLHQGETYNIKLAKKYQDKLDKLQNTQNIAIALLSVKCNNQRTREEDLTSRQRACSQLRQSLQKNRNKSLEIFQKRKTNRIQKIKKQQFDHYLEKKKAEQSDMEYRRNKSNQIRQMQMFGRQRLRRYEQFRLAQARFNYDEKKQQLFRSHAEKLNELRKLKGSVSDVEEIFRKTQVLNKEVNQIQSLYITGQ